MISLKNHLEDEYIQKMIGDPNTRPCNPRITEGVPSEWLSKFKNNQSDESHPPKGAGGDRGRPAQ